MPPQSAEERSSDPIFREGEELFRRYLAVHFEDGELDPSAIRFNEPPSFLRSAYSVPIDALHLNCSDGKPTSAFGVLSILVACVQQTHTTQDGESYEFIPSSPW